MTTYKIVRHHQAGFMETLKTGLTKEEAQEHCKDPETSSRTCSSDEALAYTDKFGVWFDGYDEE
jgi:hypothetical protein